MVIYHIVKKIKKSHFRNGEGPGYVCVKFKHSEPVSLPGVLGLLVVRRFCWYPDTNLDTNTNTLS